MRETNPKAMKRLISRGSESAGRLGAKGSFHGSTALYLVWLKHQTPHERSPDNTSFHDWRRGDFSIWGSKLVGMHAAIDMLLPLAAAAIGLTAIGIVFLICARAAA
jgi:hypothetical protein